MTEKNFLSLLWERERERERERVGRGWVFNKLEKHYAKCAKQRNEYVN